jgi:hypothetical protein
MDPSVEDARSEPAIPTEGLLLWLRADRGVMQEGEFATIWEDQSGNGFDAIQTSSNVRPRLVSAGIGGQPSLEFDGADDFLKLPVGFSDFSAGVSIFAVIHQNPSTSCTAVVELSNGAEIDDVHLGQWQTNVLYEVYDQFTEGEALPTEAPQLIAAVHRPNLTVEVRRNGRLGGEASFALPVSIERQQNFLARSLYDGCVVFGGQIAEVIVYARAISDVELLEVEGYLRERSACCDS